MRIATGLLTLHPALFSSTMMRSKAHILLGVISALCFCSSFVICQYSLDEIKVCVATAAGPAPPATKAKTRQLFLYFGDAGIEAVNVLQEYDIKRITGLGKCAARVHPDLFEDRVRTIAQKAIERAGWEGDMSQYGIRSVQYLSFFKEGLKEYRQEQKRLQLEREEKGAAFVVYPDAQTREQQQKEAALRAKMKYDPDADEVVGGYLQPDWEPAGAVAFTAVLQLSDRSQFLGGEVLIAKEKQQRIKFGVGQHAAAAEHAPSSDSQGDKDAELLRMVQEEVDVEDEDVYSDIEQERYETLPVEVGDAPQFPRFSAETTKISRFTPERGNMLLGLGEHRRGLRPVLYGRRNAVVIEFWAYADAPVGAKRPGLDEAAPRERVDNGVAEVLSFASQQTEL